MVTGPVQKTNGPLLTLLQVRHLLDSSSTVVSYCLESWFGSKGLRFRSQGGDTLTAGSEDEGTNESRNQETERRKEKLERRIKGVYR